MTSGVEEVETCSFNLHSYIHFLLEIFSGIIGYSHLAESFFTLE